MQVQNSLLDQGHLVCNSYVNFLLKTGEQIARVTLVSVVTEGKDFWAHAATTSRCGPLRIAGKTLSNVISSFVILSVRASSEQSNCRHAVLFLHGSRNCWGFVANPIKSDCAWVQ